MKHFNTTGICIPAEHYMVDISKRVADIAQMVDDGKYFTINRARQYGKSTTITELCKKLREKYIVINLDFQDLEDGCFINGGEFSKALARTIINADKLYGFGIPSSIKQCFAELNKRDSTQVKMDELFSIFETWFFEADKPIVLIVDEVDSATSNQVFIDFLAQLRSQYLKGKASRIKTFQSVILAGVTDVKHLKSKIRKDVSSKQNSPWNIADDFLIDMSLSEEGIKNMLDEYENDHHTGMDTASIAAKIRRDTNGYPYLVSRICRLIDERLVHEDYASLKEAWTLEGVETAVKKIVSEKICCSIR